MEFVNRILFWILAWLLFWNAYVLLFNKGIPNIRTAPAIRRRIIGLLRADMADKGTPSTVFDLGSGNGKFSRQIARELPGAHVVGVEISKLACLWANVFKRLCRLKNLEYRNADFNTVNLGEADAVVMFLRLHLMETIGRKLQDELKAGAIATSNKFALRAGWQPVEAVDVRTLYPHQKTFYLYRKASA